VLDEEKIEADKRKYVAIPTTILTENKYYEKLRSEVYANFEQVKSDVVQIVEDEIGRMKK
jgi:hypothetical protein